MDSQECFVGALNVAASFCAAIAVALTSCQSARGEITFEPSWSIPSDADVRRQVEHWISLQHDELDEQTIERIRQSWSSEPSPSLAVIDEAVDVFAVGDPRVKRLVDACRKPYQGQSLPDASCLEDPELAPLVRDNLRLFYGRWLAQQALYDEAVDVMEPLSVTAVVDPAALLFYRMAAHHQLVHPEQARANLVQLLEREAELPRRYRQIAQLVQLDLAALKDDSLDHIARRMSDVRRRLDHGRAGERVQTIERKVVESLDKLIEQLEQQQQQQQQQQTQSSGAPQSGQPMQDSALPRMHAPGDVDVRNLGNTSGWGDLPPKQREQALQQIGREFPAHYRDVVEQYFRELANEEPQSGR